VYQGGKKVVRGKVPVCPDCHSHENVFPRKGSVKHGAEKWECSNLICDNRLICDKDITKWFNPIQQLKRVVKNEVRALFLFVCHSYQLMLVCRLSMM
jgi:hypothetical protein